MFIHKLDFTSVSQLASAYELLALDGAIEDCSIELDALRLTFTARPPRAEALVERICRQGGLRFACREPAVVPAFELG